MNLKFLSSAFFVFMLLFVNIAMSQDRFTTIETKLNELSKDSPGLNEKVELSVNNVAIQEFIRGLATTNNLNVSIDAGLNMKIINNFSNVTVADVLLFLCKKYDLDISFIGNIMSITQYLPPPAEVAKYQPKILNINYDKITGNLSFDLNNDSLQAVAKEITRISQKNVVFSPELSKKIVSGFIQNTNFSSALEKLAFANDLKVTPTNDNFYLIEKQENISSANGKNNSGALNNSSNSSAASLNIKLDDNMLITLEALNTPIADILSSASKKMKYNYFLFTEPKGNTSLNISGATYDDFLNHLFNGTDYTFKKEGEVYLIGDRNMEGLRSTKVINLKYRTVEKMIDFIPSELKKGVDIKPFTDLNSLIVCGSEPRIQELENFLRDVDRVVPVISIEVMIVDVNNTHKVSSGIKAGLGTKPTPTGGDLYPELNFNLGANSINAIIDGINGLGVVNLGKVTPNFYLSMQLLEENGDVKINSTPLLSTLNGNIATMSIGETRYYEEDNTNTITTQSTTTVQSKVYKPLQAEFSMTINPIVSGDEQITMDIAVKQSSFTSQSSGKGSPFNTSSRDFKSLIRVKNQEMVMLGGLDTDNKNETGSGVPLLSRIPIIRWFFSSRTKTKTRSKLTIFIKPTVIY
ncbi:MAG: type II secretion system protein GspD [Bacteroidia bacterium]